MSRQAPAVMPHTARVLLLLRELRDGRPALVDALLHELRVTADQLARDLRVLRDQGCLIDASRGWIRMVDDHTSASDDDLNQLVQADLQAPARRRRRNAA